VVWIQLNTDIVNGWIAGLVVAKEGLLLVDDTFERSIKSALSSNTGRMRAGQSRVVVLSATSSSENSKESMRYVIRAWL